MSPKSKFTGAWPPDPTDSHSLRWTFAHALRLILTCLSLSFAFVAATTPIESKQSTDGRGELDEDTNAIQFKDTITGRGYYVMLICVRPAS